MNERTNLTVLVLSIAGYLAGGFLFLFDLDLELGAKLLLLFSSVGQLAAIVYLWPSATLPNSKFWKPIIACVALTAIGSFTQPKLGSLASWISFIGYLGVLLMYGVHYSNKKIKAKIDHLKLLWVTSTYFIFALSAFEILSSDFEFFTTPILWLTVHLYYKANKVGAYDERKQAGW